MANELRADAYTGQTLYAVLWSAATVWNTSGSPAFEAYNTAHWANYVLTLTETGATGHYVGNMPSSPAPAAGLYDVEIRLQLGGSPAVSDLVIGSGALSWSGTAELAAGNVVVGVNGDKAGYALTTAEHSAISGTDVPAGLVTGHLTTARADKLDDLDAAISSRMATFTDPTTALTEIAGDTDTLITNVALQATATALSTAQTAITEIATDTDTIITTQGAQATSSALATAQTAITEIAVDTDSLLTSQALQATASALSTAQTALNAIASGLSGVLSGQALQATSAALATAQTAITAIKTATDQFRFTIAHEVDANAVTGGGGGTAEIDFTQALPGSPTAGTVGAALVKADTPTFHGSSIDAYVTNIVVGAPAFSLTLLSASGPPISNVPAEREISIAAQTDLPITISVFNPDGTNATLSGAGATLLVTAGYSGATLISKDSGAIGGITFSGNVISIRFVEEDTTPPTRIVPFAKWSLKLWVGGLALAEGRGPFVVAPFGVLTNSIPV